MKCSSMTLVYLGSPLDHRKLKTSDIAGLGLLRYQFRGTPVPLYRVSCGLFLNAINGNCILLLLFILPPAIYLYSNIHPSYIKCSAIYIGGGNLIRRPLLLLRTPDVRSRHLLLRTVRPQQPAPSRLSRCLPLNSKLTPLCLSIILKTYDNMDLDAGDSPWGGK